MSLDGWVLLLAVLVYEFEFVLVGLLDEVDVVAEIGALEVDLEEDGDEDSEDQDQEDDFPGDDVGGDRSVVEGDGAHGEVEVAQDDEDVLDQEEKAGDNLEVEVELLFEGAEGEDGKDVEELDNEDEVLEHGVPEEDQH